MNQSKKAQTVYFLENTMYINLTNLCTNDCVFCIRSLKDNVAGTNLWLESEEIKAQDIIDDIAVKMRDSVEEVVFCGYGEPLIKLELVIIIAKYIKNNYKNLPVRVNTNGQANLIYKRNIVPELSKVIDRISVSLNAQDADLYSELVQCKFEKEQCFEAVKDFIRECAKNGIDTTASIVVGFKDYQVDVEKCREIAEESGAKLRIREWLEEGYN
jgi:TatD family-associated radical SAM protein